MHIYWNWWILRSFQDLRAVLLNVRVFRDAALSLKAKNATFEMSGNLFIYHILEDVNMGTYQSATFSA